MFACSSRSWKWFEIEFELNTLGPWFLKIELWTRIFYVFINVFQKMGPRGLVLMYLNVSLSLEVQSGIPRFCTSARAGGSDARAWNPSIQHLSALFYSPLERRIGRSSGVMSQARAGVERRFHPSSTFTVRSSGKVYARACTFVSCPLERGNMRSSGILFFWKLRDCFLITSLHPHPILGILRPSLRHLIEDIDVEHTEAN